MASARDELQRIEERLALVEHGLELTMAWHYALRQQADDLAEQLRQGGPDDPAPRLEALERQLQIVRRTLQDLTQIVGAWDPSAATRPPPPPEVSPAPVAPAAPPARRAAARTPAAAAVPVARARSLTHARFAGVPAPGRAVSLEAQADGLDEGSAATFQVGVRGEPGETLTAVVQGGAARAHWTVPAAVAPGTLLELVARAGLFESHSIAVVEEAAGDGAGGSGGDAAT